MFSKSRNHINAKEAFVLSVLKLAMVYQISNKSQISLTGFASRVSEYASALDV
jgi:hypothetical protein